jgi:hypothetical protein
MGINKKGSNEGCRRKNGRFARRVKAEPKAVFLLAEALQGVVIVAAGKDLRTRAEGTFFRRCLHPHQ